MAQAADLCWRHLSVHSVKSSIEIGISGTAMEQRSKRTSLILLAFMLLPACAAIEPPPPQNRTEIIDVASWREIPPGEAAQCWEACQCAVFLCGDGTCGFQPRCESGEELEGRIVLARGPPLVAPPASPGSPRRWWGGRQRLPGDSPPVFIIPWRQPRRELPLLPSQALARWVRHHLFPQRRDLARWFERQGVEIHQFTMILPNDVHLSIHRGGPRGGRWNEAWAEFRRANPNASSEEIYRHLGRLLYEFELSGPVQPYWQRRPLLPPPEAPMGECTE